MAKRYEQKLVKIKQIPPWDSETSLELFAKSLTDGHRVAWFKCMRCSLEYQVRTWRDESDAHMSFPFCPECGSKGAGFCLKVDRDPRTINGALCSPQE